MEGDLGTAPPGQAQQPPAYFVPAYAAAPSAPPIPPQPAYIGGSAKVVPADSGYAYLTLHPADTLRLVRFPETAYPLVDFAVRSAWPAGLKVSREEDDRCAEWVFNGSPWSSSTASFEFTAARRLLVRILNAFAETGLHVAGETGLSRAVSIFLRPGPPVQRRWFCVAIETGDRARLIDWGTEDVRKAFVAALGAWHRGVQETEDRPEGQSLHVKLRGWPWDTRDPDEMLAGRELFDDLLNRFDALGFERVLTMSHPDARNGETWFFATKV